MDEGEHKRVDILIFGESNQSDSPLMKFIIDIYSQIFSKPCQEVLHSRPPQRRTLLWLIIFICFNFTQYSARYLILCYLIAYRVTVYDKLMYASATFRMQIRHVFSYICIKALISSIITYRNKYDSAYIVHLCIIYMSHVIYHQKKQSYAAKWVYCTIWRKCGILKPNYYYYKRCRITVVLNICSKEKIPD